jgi:hypothetical protein
MSWKGWSLAGLLVIAGTAGAAPMRPLPVAAGRAMASGPAVFVDAAKGDDAGDGSKAKPWKTLEAAAKKLKPGDTLYLRAGTYFEAATLTVRGTDKAPITIRAMPGELAIVDAGLREFEESPKAAWEPVGAGELRSVHAFPAIAKDADQGRGVWVLGNFADSMVPLHGYRFGQDLRATNQLWTVPEKDAPGDGIYLGPGLWLDPATHKIHVRLAPTQVAGQANYAGEQDPRKLALVVGIDRSALTITNSAYLRIQDLVFRGSAVRTVAIADTSHVELDGVTIYGGAPALWIAATDHLRLTRSALRGTAAPWSSRASMKYRGISPYLFVADSSGAQSHDWEIAYCEFTDGHDGLVLDSLKTLRFHHNRVDNFNDDAIYLTLPPRKAVPEDVQIFQNWVTRAYSVFAFSEDTTGARGPNPIGPGVYIFRNVFDLREGTYGWIPKDASPATLLASRMVGDHGSPVWEPIWFYQNTVINPGPAYRELYGLAMAQATKGTKRRLFNNLFVQIAGNPGLALAGATDDLEADGNWLWGLRTGPAVQGDFFARRKPGPPGLGAHDRFGDPKLAHLVDNDAALDVRPTAGGVIDAGVALPPAWPDPLRAADRGKPDVGALPAGAAMLQVGPAAAPAQK